MDTTAHPLSTAAIAEHLSHDDWFDRGTERYSLSSAERRIETIYEVCLERGNYTDADHWQASHYVAAEIALDHAVALAQRAYDMPGPTHHYLAGDCRRIAEHLLRIADDIETHVIGTDHWTRNYRDDA